MPVINQTRNVALTTEYLNMASTSGISPQGYWFYYIPVNANNDTLGTAIKPYRWGSSIPLQNSAATMQIEGTIPLITESWEGVNNKYHGSAIEWIGSGRNDITATQESDAFFFGHLGSLSPATDDDAFYWDRAYLDLNGSEWIYYQYHKHLPLFYAQYENGRQTHSARGFINPDDKAYGWMISSRVTVMGVDYASVIARVHTPSIGGAHNSHNDVTLPTTSSKNYLPGGILKGNSNRFHAFYIAANGAQWDIFTRTYSQTSLSFSAEVNLGTYDLADPTFNPVTLTGTQSNYPVRASAGTVYNSKIYFPVIFNNPTSGFDLKIWSLNSLDTIAGGSLQQYTIASGVSVRPDCHLKVFNNKLYAVYTDVATGGVRLQYFDDTTGTWTDDGQILTNSNTKYVRVHGFEYNSADTKFYILLSGTALGGGTYVGPGLYSFNLTGTFPGYKHLDYDATTNSFINRNALASGYLQYSQIDATLTKYNTAEPAGIANGTNILEYGLTSPSFLNRKETALGGQEFYYTGINLRDGRKLLAGRISENANNFSPSSRGDLFLSFYYDNDTLPHHFAWGGTGDDYITGLYESKLSKKVWMTGYTKSQLVDKKDIKVHGWCRNFTDGTNQMQFVDVVESNGAKYAVGNHDSGYIILMKFDENYDLQWQTSFDGGSSGIDTAYGLALAPNGEIYICGKTTNVGQGLSDAAIIRASSSGRLISTSVYGTASDNYASSICIINDGGTNYVVSSVVTGTSTVFLTTTLDGSIVSQRLVNNLIVNKVRKDEYNLNIGQFLFAGNDGAGTSVAKFGVADINDNPTIKWVRTYSNGVNSSDALDIKNVDADEYIIVGKQSTSALILKVQATAFVPTKTWAKTLPLSTFNSVAVDASGNSYVVGYTTSSGIATMGMDDGLMAKYDASGNLVWQNAFGHDMSERLLSCTFDSSGENVIAVGWSESHSFGRDAILFRFWTGGYGTGLYHIEGNPGVPYIYQKTALTSSTDNNSLNSISPPSNIAGSLVTTGGVFTPFTGDTYTITNSGTNNYVFNGGTFTNANDPALTLARGGTYTFVMEYSGTHPFYIKSLDIVGTNGAYNDGVTNNGALAGQTLTFTVPIDAPDTLYYRCSSHSGMGGTINIVDNPALSNGFTQTDYGFLANIYDGSFGPDGLFTFWLGYVDLDKVQEYLNSEQHKQNDANRLDLAYTKDVFKFYQVATVGDGTADDGNVFGYDIIETTDGMIFAIGQTSGDISQTNLGASGAYDYILVEFDPATESFDYYQNGTFVDEETYALCELADGRIAYTGRTTGTLGGANLGGYDIFLGIFDRNTKISDYYSTGSGLDDKGVNIHDLGNNTLAIVFSSYGAVGPVNSGTEDVGVILFNYSTDTWGTAYQTGSQTSEIFEQNGKPSVLLKDGRIAICCSTAGIFSDNQTTYGFLDIGIAVLDRTENKWYKYQVGSGASDFASSIDAVGDRLLLAGYSRATFADNTVNAVLVEFDASRSVGAKSAVT